MFYLFGFLLWNLFGSIIFIFTFIFIFIFISIYIDDSFIFRSLCRDSPYYLRILLDMINPELV